MVVKVISDRPPVKKPDLCFAGNMLGGRAGLSYSQGQIVSNLFARDGFPVTCVSTRINKVARLLEILWTIFKGRNRFDAVVFDTYSGLNVIAADAAGKLCNLLDLPLIMVLHGGNLPEFAERFPNWLRRVLSRADQLVAPSEYLAQTLSGKGFEIKVIPNVIDLESYRFRERKSLSPRLFWMRSFHPLYDPEMAVKVLAGLREEVPEATLVMAGADKGFKNSAVKLSRDLGVSDAVEFLGFLDEESKIREFSKADIYVNTNRVDNMPVSVLEARAMGLPVVATNVGGLPYIIKDGLDGILVPDGDVESMIRGIKRLLREPGLAAKISTSGRAVAERSSWTAVRGRLEELILQTISQHGNRETLSSAVGKYSA